MNTYISMPDERRRLVCEQTGAQTGLFDSSVEKDFWVCWILEKLFSLPDIGNGLTFKGGTSLSKGWKLIERFSEDIDIVIDRAFLGFAGDQAPDTAPSNKQTKKRLESLGQAAQTFVLDKLQPALLSAIKVDMPTGQKWLLEPDTDDPQNQSLLFHYPTVFPDHPEYLKQVVKIEMGARSDTDPSSPVDIRSIIAEVFPALFPESTFSVRSVQPVRTFWEKAMLLHEETYRPENKKRRKRGMARHYYDLFQLIQKGVAESAAANMDLFNKIREHRRVYFKYTWMDYETLIPGKLRLIPLEEQMPDWKVDYTGMQQEMFYGDVPDFSEVLATVKAFEVKFNSTR
ncbi:MAG: nucleotidyl transferase AbiEii/AbiGii toxin family protein [Puniceicoccaceae bacterium]